MDWWEMGIYIFLAVGVSVWSIVESHFILKRNTDTSKPNFREED